MASKFQPRIGQRAPRFFVQPFAAQLMLDLGAMLAANIKARIQGAVTVYDIAAKPLKEAYAKYKQRRAGSNLRDWTYTGRTLRGLRVLSAQPGRAVIGFSDPVAAQRAQIQQKLDPLFGVAPSNQAFIAQKIAQQQAIRFGTQAA